MHIRKPGLVMLRLKLTGAGKHLLRHNTAGTLPLSIAVTFTGQGTKVTRSRTIILSY